MNKKQLIFGALIGLPTLAMADAKFTTTDLTIAAGETDKEVGIILANDEDGGKSFQITVTLPDGLYFGDSDYMTIANEARLKGWTLVKSQQTDGRDFVDPGTGVSHSHKWMFVGFKTGGTMPANVSDAATEAGDPILTFRVNAEDGFDAKTAGKIELSGAKLSNISGTNYSEDTQVDGVLKFDPATNWINVDGGTKGQETTFGLTPAHTQTISFELHNDAPIRGLQGYIRLPKGLSFSSQAGTFGTVGNFETTVRTEGDYMSIGTPVQEADGSWTLKFAAATMLPQFRKASEFGTPLFTFDVVGNDPEDATAPFDATQVEIVIDDFRANAGGGDSYVMDDVVKIKVTNANQETKDQKDQEIGQQTDAPAADGSIWATYNDQVANVNAWVANSSAVTAQELKAQQAIQALEHEVYLQYKAGTLQDWTDPDGLEAKAKEEIAAIATVAATTQATAEANDQAAQAAIDATEPEIPGNVKNAVGITPIKNVEGNGDLKDAKDALTTALANAKTNGTLGDNLDQLGGTNLQTLIDAITGEEGQIAKLTNAIAAAKAAADANNAAALKAVTEVDSENGGYALPANMKEDDTVFTWKTAKEALESAVSTAATAGTQADENIYAAEIAALKTALETVTAEATANNDAAAQVVIDNPLPANVAKDDTAGTYGTAVNALTQAVSDAATAGTQAKDDIYADAIQAVIDGQAAVIAKANDNNALVTDATTEYGKYDYKNNKYDGVDIDLNGMSYVNVKKNAAVKKAVADYKAAYQAVLDKQTAAATDGEQAWDDIYKTELDAFYAAEQALQDAIKAATDQAKLNQDAVNEALGKTVENPVGTGKNDAYDNIKGSDAVIDKETALADAKQALQDALATAKTSGTLGENPNKLNGAINAVNEKLTALQNELNTQSEIAAANYDIKEAAAAAAADFSAVKAENLADVNDAKIVKDAKAAFETAQNAVATKYQEMLDANKAGDPVETAALVILNAALDEALQAYNDAIATANSAIENLNQMSQTVDDVRDEVIGEIANAKVKPITADSNDFGIDNTAEFAQLMNKLLDMYNDKVAEVAQLKQDFLAGTKDAIDVAYALDKLTNEEKFTYTEEAVQKLVEFLTKYQRGDVDGDGEFTIGDYLAVRKYLINNNAPKADAAQDDHQQRYDFARADVNQDGAVDVADARGAMNVAFYGKVNGEGAAEARANAAESLVATMNGNRIAIALNNARQYCNMQLDLVLTEGMTVVGQELSARMGKHTVSGSDLGNGIYRIVITSSDIEGAIEGNEGDLLYINVEGQGNVEFQNVILADMAAGSHKFQIAGVAGGETTGIAAAKQNGVMESIYNMGGRVMNGLKKGINIIRRADGTTQKVIKK